MREDIIKKIREVGSGLMDPELALQIFDAAWNAQIVVKQNGDIQFVNKQAEFLFGYTRRQLWDKHINILVPEALRDRHLNHLGHYMSEPRVRPMGESLALKALHQTGVEFDVLIYLVPIQWEDGLLVLATVQKKTNE